MVLTPVLNVGLGRIDESSAQRGYICVIWVGSGQVLLMFGAVSRSELNTTLFDRDTINRSGLTRCNWLGRFVPLALFLRDMKVNRFKVEIHAMITKEGKIG